MPPGRTFPLVAAALVGGLALSACSAGEAPTARPSVARPTPAASTGPPPDSGTTNELTAAQAAVPKAARAHTKAGAQAFAGFYVEQVNTAWRAPDSSLIRPYATKSCKPCASFEEVAGELKAKSHRYASDPAAVLAAAWLPESRSDLVLVSVAVAINGARTVDVHGKVVSKEQKSSTARGIDVVWAKNGWRIDAMRAVAGVAE